MSRYKLKFGAIVWPLLVSSGLSVGFYLCRALGTQSTRFWFLLWNLALAWLPLLFGFLLVRWLRKGRWMSVKGLALTALWLGFLPNAFYLVTDFIHLKPYDEISLLFDAVMFMTFAWNGLLLGFVSVYMIHEQLQQRLRVRLTVMLVGLIFILSSFAIYLGRYLAWNTWDVIVNPWGILLDISDRIIKPTAYPTTFTTTTMFSILLIVSYYTVYKLVAAIKTNARN